ncbi:SCO4402 family protein [Nocardia xishanensis]|uniref:SCO4402 family protein n=1 Tax=Nocardia xishanensis TaxID=238964 RepID=UPI0034185EC9
MEELGSPVSDVRFPEMREAVVRALKSLADPQYQQRIWLERRFPHAGFYDDLDTNISTLYDDCVVIPEPRTRIGTVLVDGPEIERLIELDRELDPIIRRLGDASDAVYLANPAWPGVVGAARAALAAMTGE